MNKIMYLILFVILSFSVQGALILNMTFDASYGNNATWANDTSLMNNNGNVTLAINKTAYKNEGYSFDGTSDHINMSKKGFHNFATNFTFMAWIYPREITTGAQNRRVIYDQNTIVLRLYQQTASSQPKIAFFVDGTAQVTSDDCGNISLNTWQHLTYVYNGTTMKCHRNGRLNKTVSAIAGDLDVPPVTRVTIGKQNGVLRDFNGYIDEVLMYNNTVAEPEINLVYSSQLQARQNKFYFDNVAGNDNELGTISSPMKSISKLNSLSIIKGDTVYFHCNSTWRLNETLGIQIKSGLGTNYTTYTKYGNCPTRKPLFMGSINASSTTNWANVAGNIWNYTTRKITKGVGLVLMNDTYVCNFYRKVADLNKTNDCFYNFTTDVLYINSPVNPASRYKSIEIATGTPYLTLLSLDNNVSVHVDNLELKLTSFHAIAMSNSNRINITNMKISYVGGAENSYSGGTGIRYGNGIAINNNNANVWITNNTVGQVYDIGIQIEGFSVGKSFYNISITKNKVYLSEWGIGIYNLITAPAGTMDNILVDHNSVYGTGLGWASNQRSNHMTEQPRGIYAWQNSLTSTRINITNNIISQTNYSNFRKSTNWLGALYLNYNLYDTPKIAGYQIDWANTHYPTLALFKSAVSQEANGQESFPLFISTDSSNANFLKPNYGSIACLMSTTSSFVGAIPCATTPTNYRYTSYENFTVTTANGGTFQFNYNGLKNLTLNVSINRVRVHNGSTISEINISSSDRNVLRDNPRTYDLPTNSKILSRSINLANGTFYLSNPKQNGVLRIGASGTKAVPMYINFRGAVLIGNTTNQVSTSCVSFGNFHNWIIYNGTCIGYNRGIFGSSNPSNFTIKNMKLYNMSLRGIEITGKLNHFIQNNTIINNNLNLSIGQGIRFNNVNNSNISGNYIYGYVNSISTQYGKNLKIFNNNGYNSNHTSLQITGTNYSLIYKNRIYNPLHNGIDIDGWYNNVSLNLFYNSIHGGIDLFQTSTNVIYGGFNRVFNNTVNITSTGDGIYVGSSGGNRIYNNTIDEVINVGIHISGNYSIHKPSIVEENKIIYSGTYCLQNEINGTIFKKNIIGDCVSNEIFLGNQSRFFSKTYLINNTFLLGHETIQTNTLKNNLFIEEITPYLTLSLQNTGKYYQLNLLKNKLNLINNTVNTTYFPPYSSYCNSTVSTCQQDVTGSKKETVGAGKRIAIIAYPDDTSCAEVYSMATTATPISYSCSAGRTDYQQSGTGDTVFTITNLGSDINVYKDGTLIEVTTAGTYTISDTSAYYFTPADGSIPETVVATSQTTNALVEMINKMPIIANVIIAVVIIGLLIGMLSGQINYNDKLIKTVFWILVIFGIIMAIGINLLSGLI